MNASIVVNNYNYGRFLRDAIDSALSQDHAETEVIVVDDGSGDESREIIRSYGREITPVLKENGGQGSAFNAGFAASRGDMVIYLDADDRLRPTAIAQAAERLAGGDAAKAHWPLAVMDAGGELTGETIPKEPLPSGDLRSVVAERGPFSAVGPPTSGNAWTRRFLDHVLPMPEARYRILADCYLLDLAPLFGLVERIDAPQTDYRVHGDNRFWHSFDAQVWRHAELPRLHAELLVHHCGELGISASPERWDVDSWWESLEAAAAAIADTLPPRASFVLIDDCRWGMDATRDRRALPLTAKDGQYAGPPAGDDEALEELDRTLGDDVRFVVVGWPSFWWLEAYPRLSEQLYADLGLAFEDERVKIFGPP